MKKLLFATRNIKKLAELERIFAEQELPVTMLDLSQVVNYPEPAETERSFIGNALIKARAAVLATGLPAVADDSGLEVAVLNNMPGVRSARWAGPDATDKDNLELVLAQISDVPQGQRQARFVSAMALVFPDGTEITTTGIMPGEMTFSARGENGFGYDPAFITEGFELTNGEISPSEKDAVSHRGKAVRELAKLLKADTELLEKLEG